MSRLESFIRRMCAQRDCLNYAATLIRDLPGPVLELGLGNGRTYDHLRQILPAREIFVFDRRLAAHPDCMPDIAHAVIGELPETLHGVLARIGRPAALAHSDIGTGQEIASRELAEAIAPALDAAMAPGGIVVSDHPMTVARWRTLPPPVKVPEGRYYLYRVTE